jgi:hypothetical protein
VEVREENRGIGDSVRGYRFIAKGGGQVARNDPPRSTPVTHGVLLTGDARSSVAARRGGGETLTGGSHMSAPCAWD